MAKYVLKLYVTGETPRSKRAIDNLQKLCRGELKEALEDEYELLVIDVLEQPQLAEDERILATPTLIRELPPPVRRVIGDLTDTGKVLLGLDLHQGLIPATEGGVC